MQSYRGFPGGASGKEYICQRDVGSILRSGRSPGGGSANLLQYSCLENPVDRGAWQATVHSIRKLDMTEATYYTHTHKAIGVHGWSQVSQKYYFSFFFFYF